MSHMVYGALAPINNGYMDSNLELSKNQLRGTNSKDTAEQLLAKYKMYSVIIC